MLERHTRSLLAFASQTSMECSQTFCSPSFFQARFLEAGENAPLMLREPAPEHIVLKDEFRNATEQLEGIRSAAGDSWQAHQQPYKLTCSIQSTDWLRP